MNNRTAKRAATQTAAAARWRRLDIDKPPAVPGVYAIRADKQWLYIGRSQCISTRIRSKYHPIQITRDLERVRMSYWWQPVDLNAIIKTELSLIRAHQPEWNGSTSFEEGPYPCCYACLTPVGARAEAILAAIGG